MNQRILVLIPARYESSRFPGKPLALVSGKSLIQRVTENCQQAVQQSQDFDLEYAVVTDDDRIEEHLKSIGANVVRVDDDVVSGTERIALAQQRHFAGEWDFIINLQGDEPLFQADLILEFAKFSLEHNFDITTLLKPRNDVAGLSDSNIVKCAYEAPLKRCLYFSRESIPHAKSAEELAKNTWYHHIGVYGFRAKALGQFLELPPAQIELQERLEQLRALANGFSIGAICTDVELIGVDVPEDVKHVEKLLDK